MKNIAIFFFPIAVSILVSCKSQPKTSESGKCTHGDAQPNELTAEEQAAGWILLFDGRTSNGWRGYNKSEFPSGWDISENALHCNASGRGEAGAKNGGDIIYAAKKFRNFELSLEWKISEGGNSGIFYLAQEIEGKPIWQSAPEMQVLDNIKHRDAADSTHVAGALYDMIAAPRDIVKPVGEWNQVKLIVDKGKVEHWLNGKKVVEYHLWTSDWNEMVAKSKFPKYNPHWADVAEEGYIGLQDHGDDVWYRNIKIREL